MNQLWSNTVTRYGYIEDTSCSLYFHARTHIHSKESEKNKGLKLTGGDGGGKAGAQLIGGKGRWRELVEEMWRIWGLIFRVYY